MSYTWEVSISWGSGTAPDTIKLKDSTGDVTPTIVTAIATTDGYTYTARISANAIAKDYWSVGAGQGYPGDASVNVVGVNGVGVTPLSSVGDATETSVQKALRILQAQGDV